MAADLRDPQHGHKHSNTIPPDLYGLRGLVISGRLPRGVFFSPQKGPSRSPNHSGRTLVQMILCRQFFCEIFSKTPFQGLSFYGGGFDGGSACGLNPCDIIFLLNGFRFFCHQEPSFSVSRMTPPLRHAVLFFCMTQAARQCLRRLYLDQIRPQPFRD